ncbi:MAG: redoxin domain-containing protein [Rivularia sp. (in: Bacteria)]|nr:redoxin domain-containing protein [Rivularia sp. MS3]
MSTAEKNDLKFDVLSDVGLNVAENYGLVFEFNDELKALYQQWGIDLAKSNGINDWKLPVPGTFVIEKNGRIALAYINADYTKRLEPKEAVAVLEKLSHAVTV